MASGVHYAVLNVLVVLIMIIRMILIIIISHKKEESKGFHIKAASFF